MKEFLKKLLKAKEERMAALRAKSDASTDAAELRGILAEIETISGEAEELRGKINTIPDEPIAGGSDPLPEPRGGAPVGGLNPLGAFGIGGEPHRSGEILGDKYATVEYRAAFMKFAKTGEITPELRANATTTTADVSAIIPSTILNEVVKKIAAYGQVYSRIRKLNIKGGVTVPILSLKPAATWVGEATPSDKQKVQANTNVTFSYFGLECKVATSLLADTVTLDGFEAVITDLIVEAMIKAIDIAVIKGTGSGQFLGVTIDARVPVGNVVTLTDEEFKTWGGWKKKVFAKMPIAYKAGAAFLMASGTFEGYIDGMTDTAGQPIGRINYGITEGAQERFGGKEVVLVEDDVIAPYDDAAAGDVVAVYVNLKNYAMNSNMQMTMYRYLDHDTNEWIDKAILIADGKLIDPNGVVIVKKA